MKARGKQPTIPVRLRPGENPTGIAAGKFVQMQLDDLSAMFGPSRADIINAAIGSLYAALIGGSESSQGKQIDAIMERYDIRQSKVAELALFWLWTQMKIGEKAFGSAQLSRLSE